MTNIGDGNGRVPVSRRAMVGVVRVAKFLTAISSWFWDGVEVRWASTNGRTSAVLWRDGTLDAVLTASASTDGINQVLWMMNPEKTAAVSGPA
ncbi:hypothetical protein [Micromonospora sp. NPDC005806]|uniref:hypothetical protein n=1 Tax=Micromonospora sp. NPDC005806 TaxID=3364234 RepID=UPI0036B75152